MDIAVTDLPEPDSPTKAIVSFLSRLRFIESTALNFVSLTLKSTDKFLMSSNLLIIFFYSLLKNLQLHI